MKLAIVTEAAVVVPEQEDEFAGMIAALESLDMYEDSITVEDLSMFKGDPDVVIMENLGILLDKVGAIEDRIANEGFTREMQMELVSLDGIEAFLDASTEGLLKDFQYGASKAKTAIGNVVRRIARAIVYYSMRMVDRASNILHDCTHTMRRYRTDMLEHKKAGLFKADIKQFKVDEFLGTYARAAKCDEVVDFMKSAQKRQMALIDLIKNPKLDDEKKLASIMEYRKGMPLIVGKWIPSKLGAQGYTVKNTQALGEITLDLLEYIVGGNEGVSTGMGTIKLGAIVGTLVGIVLSGGLAVPAMAVMGAAAGAVLGTAVKIARPDQNNHFLKEMDVKIDKLIDDGKIEEYKEMRKRASQLSAFLGRYVSALRRHQEDIKLYCIQVSTACKHLRNCRIK